MIASADRWTCPRCLTIATVGPHIPWDKRPPLLRAQRDRHTCKAPRR